MMLADLTSIDITGKAAEDVLESSGITVNKNTVPGDQRSPFITSGIRIGTSALTTRGMGTDEMCTIGRWIAEVLKNPENDTLIKRIRSEVKALCITYPLYPGSYGENG
jgi:glycine hydroxymethyltransferase